MATKMGDWVTSSVEGAIAQYGIAKWQGRSKIPLATKNLLEDTDGLRRPP